MARWLVRVGVFAVVVASSACVPARGHQASATARAQPDPAQPELSAFEQRWLGACGEHGTLGECPRQSTCHFDVEPSSAAPEIDEAHPEPAAPVRDAAPKCSWQESCDRIERALEPERAALRTCFGSVEHGWARVFLSSVGTRSPASSNRSEGLPAGVEACVLRHVEPALEGVDASGLERLLVYRGPLAAVPDIGSLTKAGIRSTIHAHIGDVRRCYEAAIDVWPALQGRHAPRFVIDGEGRVATVLTATSTFENPALECCINTALKSWKFEAPANGGLVVVTYPFVLEQASGTTSRLAPQRSLAR